MAMFRTASLSASAMAGRHVPIRPTTDPQVLGKLQADATAQRGDRDVDKRPLQRIEARASAERSAHGRERRAREPALQVCPATGVEVNKAALDDPFLLLRALDLGEARPHPLFQRECELLRPSVPDGGHLRPREVNGQGRTIDPMDVRAHAEALDKGGARSAERIEQPVAWLEPEQVRE